MWFFYQHFRDGAYRESGSQLFAQLPDPPFFSTAFKIGADPKEREGVGFGPDFWVESDQALDLALKFIGNYRRSPDLKNSLPLLCFRS